MFNNVALDVFIGLVFIFLLYSLLATIIQEIFANIFSLRARMLYKGIKRMLEDDSGGETFVKKFYAHPSVKYLAENNIFSKPAYMSAETFSKTMIHLLRGEDYTNAKSQIDAIKTLLEKNPHSIAAETLKHLNNLYVDAQNDIDRFEILLEKWYNDTMDRVSGWYKRQTQWILILIGFIIAGIGNIDTIKIYRILSRDKNAREQIVSMAIQSQQKYAGAVEEIKKQKDTTYQKGDTVYTTKFVPLSTGSELLDNTYNDVKEDASRATNILGLGWYSSKYYYEYDSIGRLIDTLHKKIDSLSLTTKDSLRSAQDSLKSLQNSLKSLQTEQAQVWHLSLDRFTVSSVFGWLLLALAVSLGATFWFDLLNKMINLRNAGVKPANTTSEDSTATDKSDLPKGEQIKVIEKVG
jgi:hypothetical protein